MKCVLNHIQQMSWKLARLYPELIHLLSDRAFFWPLYDKEAIKLVYETEKFDFQASGQLAYVPFVF